MTAGPVGRTVWRNVAGTLACACCLVAAYAVARHFAASPVAQQGRVAVYPAPSRH